MPLNIHPTKTKLKWFYNIKEVQKQLFKKKVEKNSFEKLSIFEIVLKLIDASRIPHRDTLYNPNPPETLNLHF